MVRLPPQFRVPRGSSCRRTDVVAGVFAPTLLPVLSPLPPPLDGSFQLLTHRPTFPGRDGPRADTAGCQEDHGRCLTPEARDGHAPSDPGGATTVHQLFGKTSSLSNRRDGGDGMKIMWRWSEEAPGWATARAGGPNPSLTDP
jgi:hypothetical protein